MKFRQTGWSLLQGHARKGRRAVLRRLLLRKERLICRMLRTVNSGVTSRVVCGLLLSKLKPHDCIQSRQTVYRLYMEYTDYIDYIGYTDYLDCI